MRTPDASASRSKHIDDGAGASGAENLAVVPLLDRDSLSGQPARKSAGVETGQSRFAEMGVLGEIMTGGCFAVGDVAAAAAGDADFFSDPRIVVEDEGPSGRGGRLRSRP